MSKMAITISSNGPFSKCVVPLRKYTGLGITEIKNKIENKDFFAETDANDIDEYGEGIFDYQEISYGEFINNIDRLKEIMEELQDYDDALSDEV
ncbi:TPA: hypothetical protein ACKU3G_000949 [Bacillus cereus]|nr:hypothetical protein [Bacillus cereus]